VPGGFTETQIVTDEQPPARFLVAPDQRGGEMERVCSANWKPLQLNARQLAKRIGGQDLAPGTE